jgi:hypothetical protein
MSSDLPPEDQAEMEIDESYPSPSMGDRLRSMGERLRRLSPVVVLLSIASLASAAVGVWAVLSRSSPVGLLVAAGVVAGIVYALDTIAAAVGTYRAGQAGEIGRAFLLALLGGAASMISALAFAGSFVLVLLLNP